MNIKAILFDLDGTLLPMNQDLFIESYFKGLSTKLAEYGYEPKRLVDTVWNGTVAMIKNKGLKTNEEVFWEIAKNEYGEQIINDAPYFNEFYEKDFCKIKDVCGFNHKSKETIKTLKGKGYRLILATNPLFPKTATKQRIEWAGLDVNDFEIYTTYENSYHSKPFLEYYEDVLNMLNLKAEECLMVGNDVSDDMVASKLGMKVFLLTDCLINKKNVDIADIPNGSFDELHEYINLK